MRNSRKKLLIIFFTCWQFNIAQCNDIFNEFKNFIDKNIYVSDKMLNYNINFKKSIEGFFYVLINEDLKKVLGFIINYYRVNIVNEKGMGFCIEVVISCNEVELYVKRLHTIYILSSRGNEFKEIGISVIEDVPIVVGLKDVKQKYFQKLNASFILFETQPKNRNLIHQTYDIYIRIKEDEKEYFQRLHLTINVDSKINGEKFIMDFKEHLGNEWKAIKKHKEFEKIRFK